jgi:SOS-response transcriptional repressor LexA
MDNTKPLTWRQNLAFVYIRDYIEAHGYSPTIREIAGGAQLSSTSSVAYVLTALQDKGYIIRTSGRQALVIAPAHAGKVLVNREDLLDVLKLAGAAGPHELNGPVTRLQEAAGLW